MLSQKTVASFKFRLLPSILLLVTTLFVAAPAFALDLDQAKARGLVGETPSGYLASVSDSVSPDVKALVSEINAKRKAEYQKIAKENGASVASVEKLAAEKAFQKTPAGQFVRKPSGEWVKK
ncbi:MAG: YdbL family protein [Bdellovibrionales bacterium]|nr:YdbL family protein [Bdellovibrionales bacterium]